MRGPRKKIVGAAGLKNACENDNRTPLLRHIISREEKAMQCRMVELRCKEVINICDGCRLGFVGDVEVLLPEGRVAALIVPGPCRFFGLFGRGEEFYIPWGCIRQVGDDIILIDKPPERRPPFQDRRRKRRGLF